MLHVNQQDRRDPTRTTSLRRRFSAQMFNRFRALKGVIRTAIVDRDVLGLREDAQQRSGLQNQQDRNPEPPPERAFAFRRSEDKVRLFMEWLRQQEERGVLEQVEIQQIGQAVEQPWTNRFIRPAYQQGVERARTELRKAGNTQIPTIAAAGGIGAVLSQPFHVDRIGLAFTRTFNELEGVTRVMDQTISRVLAEGLAQGLNPEQVARQINEEVDGIGIRRGRMIARTEIIRAHHKANIAEMRNWQQTALKIRAEWDTANDDRVCVRCQAQEGKVFDIEVIEGLIPLHPNSYSDDTEIYTENGWKLVSEVCVGEHCLSLEPDTFDLDYQPVIQTYAHQEDEMVQFQGDDFDLLVTPDHEVFCKLPQEADWELVKARDVPRGAYLYTFPKGVPAQTRAHGVGYVSRIPVERDSKTIVPYGRMTYCVELADWHTLLVRRNGKAAWCGNCRCIALPVDVTDEPNQ